MVPSLLQLVRRGRGHLDVVSRSCEILQSPLPCERLTTPQRGPSAQDDTSQRALTPSPPPRLPSLCTRPYQTTATPHPRPRLKNDHCASQLNEQRVTRKQDLARSFNWMRAPIPGAADAAGAESTDAITRVWLCAIVLFPRRNKRTGFLFFLILSSSSLLIEMTRRLLARGPGEVCGNVFGWTRQNLAAGIQVNSLWAEPALVPADK